MADPRELSVQDRKNPFSPLMRAKKKSGLGDVVNMCPFGCDTATLDEHGYCPHLIGFTANGRTMEPRVRRPQDGRIITDGSQTVKIKPGCLLVRITTSSRVYSPKPNPALVRTEDEAGANPAFLDPEELELQRLTTLVNHPVMDGVVVAGRTSYDDDLEEATRPDKK